MRIHNSFICPYLHIFFLLPLLLFGVVKSALRLAFGWLSLPIFRLPFPSLPVPSSAPLRLRIQRSGRGRALPRHSSNSSHVIVENETNFCNLIAFRVDAGRERGEGERREREGSREERVRFPITCQCTPQSHVCPALPLPLPACLRR